jgi:hypothetical protein
MRFRFGRCILILSVASALAGSSVASARAAPTNFHFTRTFELSPGVINSRTIQATLVAVETSIPHVGRAVVSGSFETSCPPPPEPGVILTCPPAGGSTLRLEIEAKRGTLVLRGHSSSLNFASAAGSWSVVEATGRFAGYVGTGTWTWTVPAPFTGTVSIAGRLRKRG